VSIDNDQRSRLTYLSWGHFSDARRAEVRGQCAKFHEALQADAATEQAAEAFPPAAREAASRAVVAIRAFEAAIGRKTGAFPAHVYVPPPPGPWWRRRPPATGPSGYVDAFCVGIQDHFVGSRAAEQAAADAADALADLLKALGGQEVGLSSMD